jgi:NAD(P)H dehydrogenase (quinone)
MILVTGASGKTGLAIIRALSKKKLPVRAFIRKSSSQNEVLAAGAAQISIGSMENFKDVQAAVDNVESVYHICPNLHPNEYEIGALIINACMNSGCNHFVYHSVLHPQINKMPHHWQKLRVEELLLNSKMNFTILQPTAYMQNIIGYLPDICKGYYELPYPVDTKISLIDLDDIAGAAEEIISNPIHYNAIYELSGTLPISQVEVASALSLYLKRNISVGYLDINSWQKKSPLGLSDYFKNSLLAMFTYYSEFGLFGNPNVLSYLIKRPPTNLQEFFSKNITSDAEEKL